MLLVTDIDLSLCDRLACLTMSGAWTLMRIVLLQARKADLAALMTALEQVDPTLAANR